LEIYPSHADFSVRTLGITGLGALGVSFGSTLVMDSPSARDPGEFNWASTMWHEVAHAFHLAMTEHRVPRWFTEGLAVHEQHQARPHWGHRASPAWLRAYADEALFPVSELNEGFVRPRYPEQVIFSYYQASLVFQLIESQWGLEAILAMLEGYREGRSNEEVFLEVLGQTPEEFDETFDDYIQRQWGDQIRAVAEETEEGAGAAAGVFHGGGGDVRALRMQVMQHPGSFLLRLALGRALFEAERFEEAEEELQVALRLFPQYGGPDGPYAYLARIHRERGELEQAAMALHQLGRLNEALAPVHVEEAELWMELDRAEEAARALEKAVEVTPFEMEWRRTLAELHEELGEADGAVRERRAILALDPTDRADAHYRLARALSSAGEAEEARREVLRALEIAPTFDAALELLLELRGGGR
jgi:tetratricopeptide (TPR) repeat protein